MTYEEAIEYIENHYLAYVKHLQEDKEQINKHNSAMDKAIEALEKQIPLTPECIHDNKSVIMGRCPRCGKIVNNVQNGCPNCIGALDWSE